MDERGSITIRNDLRPGDLAHITALHGTIYGRECGFDATFERYVAVPLSEFIAARDPRSRIWVLERAGMIQGCIAMVKVDDRRAQLRWFLIDPSLRGKGYGKRLLERSIEFCSEQGYETIILWTVDFMKAAIGLYLKHGFVLAGEKKSTLWGRDLTEQRYEMSVP